MPTGSTGWLRVCLSVCQCLPQTHLASQCSANSSDQSDAVSQRHWHAYARLPAHTHTHTQSATSFFFSFSWLSKILPSVLWRCWLGDMKGIPPVKTEWWGAGVVICLERGADLHILPSWCHCYSLTVSCLGKIQIGFTFLVPAHPGSPGKRAVKRVCVCVCVCGWARSRNDTLKTAREELK